MQTRKVSWALDEMAGIGRSGVRREDLCRGQPTNLACPVPAATHAISHWQQCAQKAPAQRLCHPWGSFPRWLWSREGNARWNLSRLSCTCPHIPLEAGALGRSQSAVLSKKTELFAKVLEPGNSCPGSPVPHFHHLPGPCYPSSKHSIFKK